MFPLLAYPKHSVRTELMHPLQRLGVAVACECRSELNASAAKQCQRFQRYAPTMRLAGALGVTPMHPRIGLVPSFKERNVR